MPQQTDPSTATIPDTAATRLLRSFGVLSPALLRKHAAAPLDLIRRAEARRVELGYSAGLIGRILDDGGVMWGRCGHHVDKSRLPAPHEDDAGHHKYTGGALGQHIRTGWEHPPPDRAPPSHDLQPADDPDLAKYRGRGMPWWGAGDAP